ncbi:MAG: hypothetical protein IJS65_00305, partial [Clostridia bacterium]|nr:hypothetical protein [Clostridia bacterium]
MSKAFKKAFIGGFSKKDVIQYIADLEKRNVADAAESAEKIASEREARAALEDKLSAVTDSEKAAVARAQGLESELSKAVSEKDELNEKL